MSPPAVSTPALHLSSSFIMPGCCQCKQHQQHCNSSNHGYPSTANTTIKTILLVSDSLLHVLQADMPPPAVLTPVSIPRQASPVQPVMAPVSANSTSSTATAAVLASLRQRHSYASQGAPLLPLGQLPPQQLQQLPQQDSPVTSQR